MIDQQISIKQIFKSTVGTEVIACGWVKTKRTSKEVIFIQLNDGSCFDDLQIIVPSSFSEEILKKVTTGASIMVQGIITESPASGQVVELHSDNITLLGEADPLTYPLQKKGASFEFLREKSHLRVRTNTFGAVFRIRNKASIAIHNFFQKQDFQYVHTPIITASDCEGGGELFSVSTLLKHSEAGFSLQDRDSEKDFFGKPAYLTVSGQLNGEALAHGLSKIYTFGPTFRAENSNSSRHLAEFWMIEPEMAFCDLKKNIQIAEQFLKEVISEILDNSAEDLQFFNHRIEPTLLETLTKVVESSFEVMTYTEAVQYLKNCDQAFEYPVEWGTDLQSEHERWLTENKVGRPVVLIDYPKEIKAFYMRQNDDQKTVGAMDVLVPRIGEIIGGGQREENYDVLLSRIIELGLNPKDYQWYLELRKYGTVPHAGFGLGFERLIMYLTGMKNVRDVIPFYRTPGYAEF